MPITSVSTANLYLRASRTGLIFRLLCCGMLNWVIVSSAIPLPVALFLFGLSLSEKTGLLTPEYTGILRIRKDGYLVAESRSGEKKEHRIVQVNTRFRPLMIGIKAEHQPLIRIWRDSCAENDYRHLSVMVQQIR